MLSEHGSRVDGWHVPIFILMNTMSLHTMSVIKWNPSGTQGGREMNIELLLDGVDQLGQANPQGSGQFDHDVEGEIPLPILNLGNVVAVNIRQVRQLFLANASLLSEQPDSFSQLNEDISHADIVEQMTTIGL